MLGREAYHNPGILMQADERYFGKEAIENADSLERRIQAVRDFYPYIEDQLSNGATLHYISRHMLGLFNGMKGARQFRRHLSENAFKKEACIDVMEAALSFVE